MGKDIAMVAGDAVVPTASALAAPVTVGNVTVGNVTGGGKPVASAGTGLDRRGQRGMVSAEWAVGIVAAVAIAGVLLAVVTSGEVQDALLKFLLWVIKSFVSVVD
jgi:hypothetical protein